ncbi:MAG: hypothetical protein AUJ00_00125 [Gemmatimonadetes bacterium 13_1_40CM_3_70_6]|nr:MAG: hypothetical protein AUJ00_00125 [Gemmatimonadetes bacterium 13_1_40CM_3_70_6]
MRRFHPPRADGDRPIVDRVDAQPLEALDRADDIEHRVYRSDLVQVHALRRHAVDASFRLAEEPERAHRALLDCGGQRRALDELHQLADVPAMRLPGDREFHLLAPYSGPSHIPNGHADAGEPQPRRQLFQPGGRHAKRQQGAERHVATDAGGRVEDRDPHEGSVEI